MEERDFHLSRRQIVQAGGGLLTAQAAYTTLSASQASAAGDPLGAAHSFDQAWAAVRQNDLEPVRVH